MRRAGNEGGGKGGSREVFHRDPKQCRGLIYYWPANIETAKFNQTWTTAVRLIGFTSYRGSCVVGNKEEGEGLRHVLLYLRGAVLGCRGILSNSSLPGRMLFNTDDSTAAEAVKYFRARAWRDGSRFNVSCAEIGCSLGFQLIDRRDPS